MLLTRSKTAHAPLAAIVTAFSTYLIGLCIHASRRSWWRLTPIQTGQIAHLTTVTDYGAGTQGPTKIGQTGGNGSSAEIPPIERGARHRAMLLKSKVPARRTACTTGRDSRCAHHRLLAPAAGPRRRALRSRSAWQPAGSERPRTKIYADGAGQRQRECRGDPEWQRRTRPVTRPCGGQPVPRRAASA